MVAVGALHPARQANPVADSGVTDALTRYFNQAYNGDYSAAVHQHTAKALRQMQRDLKIHGESGKLGPKTTAALQGYGYGRPQFTNPFAAIAAFFSRGARSNAPVRPAVDYRRSARNPAQGLDQPRAQRVSTRATAEPQAPAAPPTARPGGLFGALFGGGVGASAAQEKLLQQTGGQLQPNHAYVVQIDHGGVGEMNGDTYVFHTNAAAQLDGSPEHFKSSSLPSSGDARQSMYPAARAGGFPHLIEAMYHMSTSLSDVTRGFSLTPYRPVDPRHPGLVGTYRDANMDGRINGFERNHVTLAGDIMIHSDRIRDSGPKMQDAVRRAYNVSSVGDIEMISAGCQRVHNFPAFAAAVRRHAGTGASYLLSRT